MRGTVEWFDDEKGYGFIACESGSEVYVHFREIVAEGHRTLKDGERVEFELVHQARGPEARRVVVEPRGRWWECPKKERSEGR